MAGNVISIIISAKDAFSGVLGHFEGALKQISNVQEAYNQKMQAFSRIGDEFTSKVLSIGAAIGAGALVKQFVDFNSSVERSQVLLTSLYGSSQKADEAFQWIRETTSKTTFSIDAMQSAFVKLKSAGIDPMGGALQTLADAITAFGGTEQDLQLAATALQQMAGKGTISMEELRQQLGERIPTAVKAMAEGLGMSVEALIKKINQGEIKAMEGINAMMTKLKEYHGGMSSAMENTWIGLMAKLKNAWQDFLLAIADTGVFAKMKEQLQGLLDQIHKLKGNEEFKRFINELGSAIVSIIKTLSNVAMVLGSVLSVIAPFLPTLIEIITVLKAMQLAILGPLGALYKFGTEIIATVSALKQLTVVMSSMQWSVWAQGIAIIGVAIAGWELGKWISQWRVLGLTIGEWVQIAYAKIDRFVTDGQILFYKLWSTIKGVFGGDTKETDAKIKELERYKDVTKQVEASIYAHRYAEQSKNDEIKKGIAVIGIAGQANKEYKRSLDEVVASWQAGTKEFLNNENQKIEILKESHQIQLLEYQKTYGDSLEAQKGYLSLKLKLTLEVLNAEKEALEQHLQGLLKDEEKNAEEIIKVRTELEKKKLEIQKASLENEIAIKKIDDAIKKLGETAQSSKQQIESIPPAIQDVGKAAEEAEDKISNATKALSGFSYGFTASDVLDRWGGDIHKALENIRKAMEWQRIWWGSRGGDVALVVEMYTDMMREMQQEAVRRIKAIVDRSLAQIKTLFDSTNEHAKEFALRLYFQMQRAGIDVSRLAGEATDAFIKQLDKMIVATGDKTRAMLDYLKTHYNDLLAMGIDVSRQIDALQSELDRKAEERQRKLEEQQAKREEALRRAEERAQAKSSAERWLADLLGDKAKLEILDFKEQIKQLREYFKEGLITKEDADKALAQLQRLSKEDLSKLLGSGEITSAEYEKALQSIEDLSKTVFTNTSQELEGISTKIKSYMKEVNEYAINLMTQAETLVNSIANRIDTALSKIKNNAVNMPSLNISAVSGATGVSSNVNFTIQSFDADTTRRWIQDSVIPEINRQIRLR